MLSDFDLELFERGQLVNKCTDQRKEDKTLEQKQETEGLDAVVQSCTAGGAAVSPVQPQVSPKPLIPAPFSNVTHFIQINNGMEVDYEKFIRGLLNAKNQN